jgi:virulence-associated protein VapD
MHTSVYFGQQYLTQMHTILIMIRSIIQLSKHYRHVHGIQGLFLKEIQSV